MGCNNLVIIYSLITILTPLLIAVFIGIWRTEGREVCLKILAITSIVLIAIPSLVIGVIYFYKWLLC